MSANRDIKPSSLGLLVAFCLIAVVATPFIMDVEKLEGG